MKVALLTNLTNRLSLPILSGLSVSTDPQLCHVLFYDTVSEAKGSFGKVLREQGLKATIANASEWMARYARIFFRKRLRWRGGQCRSCYEYVVAHALPYSLFRDMNQPEVVALLKQLDVDILLVCSCRQILKKQVLTAPNIASINVHPSLLPKYRGPVPVFWALYDGESETGVTFHLMTEMVDGGDVIAQFKVPIATNMDEQALSSRLFEAAGARVAEIVRDFARGNIQPQCQTRNLATYYGYPTSQQRRQFRRRDR